MGVKTNTPLTPFVSVQIRQTNLGLGDQLEARLHKLLGLLLDLGLLHLVQGLQHQARMNTQAAAVIGHTAAAACAQQTRGQSRSPRLAPRCSTH